jgi:glycosyltransferase involved in cell wall biosynthesis
MSNRIDPDMASMPKISVVTCSYQQAPFLELTLRSVLEQGYPNLEYLVVDGGSTDGSVALIERYSDSLAYFVSEKDHGQSEALNKGLRKSTGEIVGWLCSDDLLLPGSLKAVASYFAANPGVDAVYGNSILINARGKVLRAKREMGFSPFSILHDHNYIPQPSMFWRRSLMGKAGFLDESLHLSMDADYWMRFAMNGRVRHIPTFLSCMRTHDSQKVFLDRPGVFREAELLRLRYSKTHGSGGVQRLLRWYARLYRIGCRWVAHGYEYSVPDTLSSWLEGLHEKSSKQGRRPVESCSK